MAHAVAIGGRKLRTDGPCLPPNAIAAMVAARKTRTRPSAALRCRRIPRCTNRGTAETKSVSTLSFNSRNLSYPSESSYRGCAGITGSGCKPTAVRLLFTAGMDAA